MYTYDYEGAAVNDTAHSAGVSTANPKVKKFSEFRGHSSVTEHAPGGRKIITSYYQDDIYKGQAYDVEVRDGSNLYTKQINQFDYVALVTYVTNPDLAVRWVRTISQENRTYNGNSDYTVTKQTHTYENTYGNITDTVSAYLNSSGWVDYRKQHTSYYPNASAHLVNYPAAEETYSCSGGACSTLQAATYYIYDANSAYTATPTDGLLTKVRTLVSGSNYSQASYAYDGWGNRTSATTWSGYGTQTTDPSSGGRSETTTYDASYHTYPVSSTNALSQTTSWTYNYTLGVPLSETDPNGQVTTAAYDTFGRMTSLTKPLDSNPAMTIAYTDGNPFSTTVTQRVDASSTYAVKQTYDGLGRKYEQRVKNAQVVVGGSTQTADLITSYGFDADGNITSQSVPHTSGESGGNTTTAYDVLGRPVSVTAADGTNVSYTYADTQTTSTDASGHTTTNTLDVLGRTIQVTPPTGPGVSYAYDALDRLTQTTYGSVVTNIQYDAGGRKTGMQDADMGSWTYVYNALSALTSQTDARGCITTLGYDNLNRLTGKTYSGSCSGTAAGFTYDQGTYGKGQRTGMSDASGSTSWTYDARGRLTGETKVIGGSSFATGWSYNLADLPVTQTYPDGEVVTSSYTPQLTLSSLTGTDAYISASGYDSAGRVVSQSYGNGVTQTHSYNPWSTHGGRLANITAGTLQNLSYTYDNGGNILTIVDATAGPQTQTFTYDNLDRLSTADATGGTDGLYTETYGYDAATGNIASKAGLSYTYGATAHPHAVTGLSDGSTYGYDANGSMNSRTRAGVDATFIYNAENKLTQVVQGETTIATFVYDADGTRVQATIAGVTTRYVGEYYEVTGTDVTKYYGGHTAMRKSGVVSYLLSDHLGSNSLIVDSTGAKVSESRYKAWGELRFSSGTVSTDYTYTGQYSNTDDFGWMYYKARWYDPTLGRFAQADSIVPGAGNPLAWDRYAYGLNNPTRYNDPDGHCPICLVALIIIGAVVLNADTPRQGPGDAGNVMDLVTDGLQHEEHARIVGEGLQSLQDDPSVKDAQGRVIDFITDNPNYGKHDYSHSDVTDQFTANGPSRNWKEAAITGNQAFWMVHTGTITATNIQVSADGSITTTWHIHDYFDFIPGPNHSDEYNYWATKVHYVYNNLLGAEETYPTDAYWNATIPPQKKKSTSQQPLKNPID